MSLEMKLRVLAEDGPCWQNSRTTLRMGGTNAPCPLAGAERSWALNSADAMADGERGLSAEVSVCEYVDSASKSI